MASDSQDQEINLMLSNILDKFTGSPKCPSEPPSMAKYQEEAKIPQSRCTTCDLHERAMLCRLKRAKDTMMEKCLRPGRCPQATGSLMQDVICEDNRTLQLLNQDQMGPFPETVLDGIYEKLGELPMITLHKLAQKREDYSGKYYPEERGLARVCNPVGSSYLTARPYRCNGIYRCCEPMGSSYTGHVPGEQFVYGKHRGEGTRNALKYMTYRV